MPVSSHLFGDPRVSYCVLTYLQAYHSALNEEPDIRQVGNLGVYPIKTRLRGPAPLAGDFSSYSTFLTTIDLYLSE